MPQPPVRPLLSRELVRSQPFRAQRTFNVAALAAAGTLIAAFDIGLAVTDVNQFIGGVEDPTLNPSADPTQHAIGPWLDAMAYSDQNGTITVEYAVDYTCSYRQMFLTAVVATVPINIAGLRITGRFTRITFTNTPLVPATDAAVEFGVWVGSA